MARRALSPLLIPPASLLELYYAAHRWGTYAQQLRAQALQSLYQERPALDKELSLFMPSLIDWQVYSIASRAKDSVLDLGSGAWIADIDSLPFIPSAMAKIREIIAEPWSFGSLIAATFTKAQVLYVPESNTISCDLLHRSKTSGFFACEVLILVIEDGASVNIVRHHDHIQGIYGNLLVGFIGAGGQVTFITDQYFETDAFGVEHESWHLAEGAKLKRLTGLTGGKQTWAVRDFILHKDTSVEHSALFALKGQEQAALLTYQTHKGKDSTSSVNVKTLCADTSRFFYRGLIEIEQAAQCSRADLQHRSLLLSSGARSCAIPSLEVATDDVQCRHGSAVGKFSDEEMTYLLSRGFDREFASQMLIEAFYAEQVSSYSEPAANTLKNRLVSAVLP